MSKTNPTTPAGPTPREDGLATTNLPVLAPGEGQPAAPPRGQTLTDLKLSDLLNLIEKNVAPLQTCQEERELYRMAAEAACQVANLQTVWVLLFGDGPDTVVYNGE